MLLNSFLLILTAWCASLVLTPIIRHVAVRLGVVDQPGGRKIHRLPVPNLGGVSVYLSICLTIFIAHELELISGGVSFGLGEPTAILWGMVIVFLIGFYDDLKPVAPWVKLLFQCIAAGIVLWSGIRIDVISIFGSGSINPGIFAVPLTFLWIVGLTNAFNLIDGLDGLAAGLGIIAATTSAIIFFIGGAPPSEGALLLILAGALAGFIRYNFHPASIFLGDSGSQLIGYVLAVTSISGSQKVATALPVIIPLLVFGLPLIDTGLSMLRRMVKRGRPHEVGRRVLRMFVADQSHIHHRLIELGLTHRAAVATLHAIAVGLSGLAIVAVAADFRNAGTIVLAVAVGGYLGVRMLGYEELAFVKTGTMLRWCERVMVSPVSSVVVMDVVFVIAAYWTTVALKYDGLWTEAVARRHLTVFPFVFLIQTSVFLGYGLYRGPWRGLWIADVFGLSLAVTTAVLFSYILSTIYWSSGGAAAFFCIDWLLLHLLVVGGRSLSAMLPYLGHVRRADQGARVLIYAAGRRGESILRELVENGRLNLCPVGFLDDDPALRGLKINGVPVLGSSDELGSIFDSHKLCGLIVSSHKISEERLAHVTALCSARRIPLLRCEFQLNRLSGVGSAWAREITGPGDQIAKGFGEVSVRAYPVTTKVASP